VAYPTPYSSFHCSRSVLEGIRPSTELSDAATSGSARPGPATDKQEYDPR
jgi:hypothetical protein